VMRALHAREGTFRGEDECTGTIGPSPCVRIVRFEAVATYQGEQPTPAAPRASLPR
jgi:hypothetical protein